MNFLNSECVSKDTPSRCDPTIFSKVESYQRGSVELTLGYAERLYTRWPAPVCIISDGPYGIRGFPGDLADAESLLEWYRPHVDAWSQKSTPQTTLWFWNTELGWATIHPLLKEYGWQFRGVHVWDKGLGHVAGNTNTHTLRKFPVTTEVCVQYVKEARISGVSLQEWLRSEWRRSGLPLRLANEACGVVNAATRKYLTADQEWYFPPPEAFAALAAYANTHGNPLKGPYFSQDGKNVMSQEQWAKQRAKFHCTAGVTNVWRCPHVSGAERIKEPKTGGKQRKNLHSSQKPLALIERVILASTDPGDVVWEPFGGLCPAALKSWQLDRRCYSAEIIQEFYDGAKQRIAEAEATADKRARLLGTLRTVERSKASTPLSP